MTLMNAFKMVMKSRAELTMIMPMAKKVINTLYIMLIMEGAS